ncbi:diguanylate cyclase domain-containing protein [Pseudomonas syringae]
MPRPAEPGDADAAGSPRRVTAQRRAATLLSAEGTGVDVTVSLGCSTLPPGESPDSMVQREDTALYAARRKGRHRLDMAG